MSMNAILLAAVKSAAEISVQNLLLQLSFDMIIVWGIIHFLYYNKSKRSDYYFTFLLISLSIFFVILLLSGLKMKIGFALGLFSVFGILRYRTVLMPVREMTYLFVLITISVLNALTTQLGWDVRLVYNVVFIIVLLISELLLKKRNGIKYIKYDRIDLCVKSKRQEMIADIEDRLGLKVLDIQIGSVNFLKDMALIKVIYVLDEDELIDDEITKMPKE